MYEDGVQQIHTDKDVVVGKMRQEPVKCLWDEKWVKELKAKRVQVRETILKTQKNLTKAQKYYDAYKYYEYLDKLTVAVSESDIAQASEPVLHEIIGIIATEKETEWDKAHTIPDSYLSIIYGLLCLIDKPLLPDQASDLNLVLNIMLKHRQDIDYLHGIESYRYLAALDTNIALITEYFDQRFK